MQPFSEKYKPKNSKEIIGQNKIVETLKDFITNYKTKKKKAVMLYGGVGYGKSSTVSAIANEMGLELHEINASDFRDADSLNKQIGNALKQRSLFFKEKIILIDEIDNLAPRKDRGAVQTVISFIKSSNYPIVLTSNDPWDSKLKNLRNYCDVVQMNTPRYTSIASYLKKICTEEGICFDESALKQMSRNVGGDIRAALMDLQAMEEVSMTSVEGLALRSFKESIINAISRIFRTEDMKIAFSALDNVSENLNEVLLWMSENIPYAYTKVDDRAKAYEMISRTDIFNGRIMKRQDWRFLVYSRFLLSSGIALSKKEKYRTFVKYRPTKRILKLWQAKQKNAKEKEISKKLAKNVHMSSKKVFSEVFPYFKIIYSKHKELADQLKLDDDERDYLE